MKSERIFCKGMVKAKSDDSSREIILEVATKLFAEKGFDSTSTREIAQTTGLNISLISYYFESKEGLYKAVIEEFANKMKSESEKVFNSFDINNLTQESYLKFMRELIIRMIPMKYALKDVNLLLLREMIAGLPYAKEVFEQTFSSIAERLVSVVERAQKKGIVRADVNPYVLFFSLAHSVDQFIMMSDRCQTRLQKNLCQLPEDMNQYSEQVFKIFVEGVLND